ncbi:MAG TPA: hypothetical protein PKA98_03225 [Acidimicrobiales bacterium]|nr:hypothetical protein [Acidimicrobiales bacterium]
MQSPVKPPRQAPPDRAPGFPGFQKITGQHVVLGAGEPVCTVFGRLHRRPIEQRVPLAVALELARRGVHTVVRVAEG